MRPSRRSTRRTSITICRSRGLRPKRTCIPVSRRSARRLAGGVSPGRKGLRLVGHQWSPQSHAIKDFLASNLIPYRWLDVERDAEARALLEAAGVARRTAGAVLRRRNGAAQIRNRVRWPSVSADRSSAAHGRLRSRDRRRRSRRPGGGGVRRVGRAARRCCSTGTPRRSGGHQFADRELSRLSQPASAAAN